MFGTGLLHIQFQAVRQAAMFSLVSDAQPRQIRWTAKCTFPAGGQRISQGIAYLGIMRVP